MAMSSCVRCGNHTFELRVGEPHHAVYKLFYIQCTSCGGVAGVTDYTSTSVEMKAIKVALKSIASQVGAYVKL